MAHIKTQNNYPGILELLWYKPSTGSKLSAFAHELLLGKSGLTSGERETIAAYTSSLNACEFCSESHNGAAMGHLKKKVEVRDYSTLEFMSSQTPKMQALLAIAAKTQQGGKQVSSVEIEIARKVGATDEDIHDTVLIAAAFCMFNRYVDGLATTPPADKSEYLEMGQRLSTKGYKFPPRFLYGTVRRILDKKYGVRK